MSSFSDIESALSKIIAAILGASPVAVGLIMRLVFFSQTFVLDRIFLLRLENIGLLFGMVSFAFAIFWVLDSHNMLVEAHLILSLISVGILWTCWYTGIVFPFDIPIPLIAIVVPAFYTALFLLLHIVWPEWCLEYITASLLLFAAIFTENEILSMFAFSFSLIIVMMIRGYGKPDYSSHNVFIYRFGKLARKRSRTIFLIIPLIEKFRPEADSHAPEDYCTNHKNSKSLKLSDATWAERSLHSSRS